MCGFHGVGAHHEVRARGPSAASCALMVPEVNSINAVVGGLGAGQHRLAGGARGWVPSAEVAAALEVGVPGAAAGRRGQGGRRYSTAGKRGLL